MCKSCYNARNNSREIVHKNNPEYRAKRNRQQREFYKGNRVKILEKKRQYHSKAEVKIRTKTYRSIHYQIHKNRINEQKNRYAVSKKKNNPRYKLECVLRSRLKNAIFAQNASKEVKTMELLGRSSKDCLKYIESKFKDGMNWENHGNGQGKWNLDHIIPCASFNLTNPKEQMTCFHWSNLQPLWYADNLKKADKITTNERCWDELTLQWVDKNRCKSLSQQNSILGVHSEMTNAPQKQSLP